MDKLKIGVFIYLFTSLILPLLTTVLAIFVVILGLEFIDNLNFLQVLEKLWINYYTGQFLDVDAWRIHILWFILCILFSIILKY